MRFFPQLWTGATAQYPIIRRRIVRTVVNSFLAGAADKALDGGERRLEWDIAASGLTNAERDQLQALFDEVEGRLRTFTFMDPMQNLLLSTDDLTADSWTRGPLLQLTSGLADPEGGTKATQVVNTGAAAQRITQAISGFAGFQYCFSLWIRSAVSTQVALLRFAGGQIHSSIYGVTSLWNRICLSGKLTSAAESIEHGCELQPGVSVELFGSQLEAQVGPSGYKRRLEESAVITNARFRDDQLSFTAHGPNNHSVAFGITATV